MLGHLAWKGFSYAYGCFNLVSMVTIAYVRDGALFKRQSNEEKEELQTAQKRYWSLDGAPLPGFAHQFFVLRNGLTLHYAVNASPESSGGKNVAIFIHGFPDSFLLWRNVLTASTLESNILIAVDLPGYGGSDNLLKYGPNEVLETMAEFILGMREQFLGEEAKMVVVSHDWGAIVAARLASEASQLADRWVVTSGCLPHLIYSNVLTRTQSAKQMVHTYLRRPLNFSLLKNAFSTLTPVLSQMGRSFYIFCFNLPRPLAAFFNYFGDYWLLKTLHNVAAGFLRPDGTWVRKLNKKEQADFLAMSAGPGLAQLQEGKDETLRYPDSVKNRVKHYGLVEKIRFYRESLFLDPWEKSLETVVALSELPARTPRSGSRGSGAGLFDEGPQGALKAPSTIVYGIHDPGFDRRLALDGIGDYVTKDSQVVIIDDAGHWLPFEGLGSKVLEVVAGWALGDEQAPLKESLAGVKEAKIMVEK